MEQQKFRSLIARCALVLIATFFACFATASAAQETQTRPSDQGPSDPSERGGETNPDTSDADAQVETMFPRLSDTRFWLSGQANFISQGHPAFYAKYSGKNSFRPNFQEATSRIFTLYTGVRLNDSTELLVDIEDAAGYGMSNSLGLAGYTNLDVVRVPGEGSPLSTAPYLARAIIHKVFALSKDKVENERNPLSLFGELPRRRLEFRLGKFDVVDFFDQNSVGSDTHFQFMNWTLDANGAYDYAADTRGYTVGLVAEYEDRNWGFRFMEALMPKIANGIDLVYQPWKGVHADNWEYELRRGFIPKKPGVVRLLAYTNYANMGVYKQAIAQFEEHRVPTPEITSHPFHITRKYGFGVNIEQNLARNLRALADLAGTMTKRNPSVTRRSARRFRSD